MDKIWDRSPSKSEVIGCCGWGRKIKWPCRTDKSNAKKRRWSNCWLSEWCVLWVQMSFYILHGMTNKSGTRSWYSRCSMKLKPKLPLTRLHRLCFFISHIMFFSWQVTFNTSPHRRTKFSTANEQPLCLSAQWKEESERTKLFTTQNSTVNIGNFVVT